MADLDATQKLRIEDMVTGRLGPRGELGDTMHASESEAAAWQLSVPTPLPTLSLEAAPGHTALAASGPEFSLLEQLGAGGMGVVMLARQRSLQREVAIKLSHSGAAHSSAAEAALMEEAVVTGGLEHPNIVPVHAYGRDASGRPVLVMKRVAGQSWAELLKRPRESTLRRLQNDPLVFHLSVLIQVSNALHFAHSRGVVHRDLKPDNVMIGAFGEIYLLDWGLAWRVDEARATRVSDSIVGTLPYMAPEMLLGSGAHITPRTDVYLLGAVLHQVLTGRPRHGGATVAACIEMALASEPAQFGSNVPRELAELSNRATSRDPAQRPASAQEFRDALEEFLQHRSSVQLADESALRLARLDKLLRVGPDKADPVAVQKLFAECRFGLQQALRIWVGNMAARGLLRTAIVRQCEFELAQRKLESAQDLLSELDDPPPGLVDQLQHLREELRDEQARFDRLKSLEHELDSRVSSRQRVWGSLVSGAAMSLGLAAFAVLDHRGQLALNFTLVYLTLLGFSGLCFAIFLRQRRALLRTRFNRDLMGSLVIATACVFLASFCAQRMNLGPRQAVVLVMLCISVLQAAIGTLAYRPFLGASAFYLAGSMVALLWPPAALASGSIALLCAHCYVAWRWARESDTASPELTS